MKEKIINLAKSQVGYKETGTNRTKYAADFDTTYWQWFNTKKQGVEWCAIFICWLFVVILGPEKARKFLGCPKPADNCAAGVKYLKQYLKKTGTTVNVKDGKAGDICFFGDKHVGIIEYVEGDYYHTIEGNKSNSVARGKYKKGSSITTIIRPAYAADELPTPATTPAKPKYEFPTIPARGYFRNGDRGTEVKKMQKILLAIIPTCLPRYGADGIEGQETLAAVEAVQKKLGGLVCDRLYGPKTNAACKAYLTK